MKVLSEKILQDIRCKTRKKIHLRRGLVFPLKALGLNVRKRLRVQWVDATPYLYSKKVECRK